MPNGRSGGFVIPTSALAAVLERCAADSVIGTSSGRPVTTKDVRQMLGQCREEIVRVEEQDGSCYILHLREWVAIDSDSQLFASLREIHRPDALGVLPPPIGRGLETRNHSVLTSAEIKCRIMATRESDDSPVWSFYLINDSATTIELAVLETVKYEWGDQYVGGDFPGVAVADLPPRGRAFIWRNDGTSVTSELRNDLWLRVKHRGLETWLLFEFPKLHRQQGTTLIAHPITMPGPPSG